MNTTLNKILEHDPCNQDASIEYRGWNLLLHNLNKTKPDNRPLSFKRILKSNGIKDAVWALKTLDYKQYCMFIYDVSMLVIDNFEAAYPDDKRPRQALEAIKKYHNGEITIDELNKAAYNAAYIAAHSAADSAAYSASWVEIEKIFIKHFC